MTSPFHDLIDLAAEQFGGIVIAANDEFFAPKGNLIKASAPRWIEGRYTDRGKWMDGWETRRRRDGGSCDWCVIRLGAPGIVKGIDVETTHFTGNFPEMCAIDVGSGFSPAAEWHEIVGRTPLTGNAHNRFVVASAPPATHVRLRIFPDGGVARLRVHGTVVADWDRLKRRREVDLAAAQHGGLVVSCSDMFFGSRHNLIMPGDATHMGDGWETKRRRGPGHDWTIIQLAQPGTIHRVEVDTRHFKGNAPAVCWLEGTSERVWSPGDSDPAPWPQLLSRSPLRPDVQQAFSTDPSCGELAHVRFNIAPDGGVGRLRLWGVAR